MSNFLKNLEESLSKAAQTIDFTSQSSEDHHIKADKKSPAFTQLLDFTFPTEIEPGKVKQVGEVTYVGDGVVHVMGLDKVGIEQVLNIRSNKGTQKALILGIQENKVEAVVMGDYASIKRGDTAIATGETLKIGVGEQVLGRVINPLGQAIDGGKPLKTTIYREVEFPAPGVMDRKPIDTPLHTGVMVVDTTIPVGKGQRELVVGDRKSGKSRTCLDIISNQKGQNVICVYVGVGIQAAKAKATLKLLQDRKVMDYTCLVISLADEPPTLQYISPYVGVAIAEHFMYQGKDVLIVYDDLSKQAKAYRQVSLLLKRSPGRDAYPGDIFFLHSRLLERSSRVTDDLGGGSITALPIAETQAGDLSDYIITNLMSITDGHIYLDTNLMHEGVLPAVNSGASVSRIGGKVQTPLLRKVGELAGRVLARYNEVKSFETINTEVAEETLREIKRGKRIKEIFSQDTNLSMSADEEVALLGIATSSRMDHLELVDVGTFKDNFIPFYRQFTTPELIKISNEAKDLELIDANLDELFKNFCIKSNLPLPPKI